MKSLKWTPLALAICLILQIVLIAWMFSSGEEYPEISAESTEEEPPHFNVVQILSSAKEGQIDAELEPIAPRLREGCFEELKSFKYLGDMGVEKGGEASMELHDGGLLVMKSNRRCLDLTVHQADGKVRSLGCVRCDKDVLSMTNVVMLKKGSIYTCHARPGIILWIDCPWDVFGEPEPGTV